MIWSPEARADLSEIWSYYFHVAGSQRADNIVRSIHQACQTLEDQPHAGRMRSELREGLRSFAATPYVIFYRLSKDETPEIIRVLDGRRDIDEIFGGEPA